MQMIHVKYMAPLKTMGLTQVLKVKHVPKTFPELAPKKILYLSRTQGQVEVVITCQLYSLGCDVETCLLGNELKAPIHLM